MFVAVLIVSVILVLIAFLGLGLNIFFRKNGRFPDTEISSNPAMKNLGITCAKQDELTESGNPLTSDGYSGKQSQPPMRDCGYGCSCAALES